MSIHDPHNERLAFLEHYSNGPNSRHRIVLNPLPFRIGRSRDAGFSIKSREISKEHAEIFQIGQDFFVRDLGSTNGTFVNGRRVTHSPLCDGDILHIAHKEFVFSTGQRTESTSESGVRTMMAESDDNNLATGWKLLDEVVDQRLLFSVYQSIVDLKTTQAIGWEALGRSSHEGIGPSPAAIFHLAELFKRSMEISRIFRETAVSNCHRFPTGSMLFLNMHPEEIIAPEFVDSVIELRQHMPVLQRLILEVHEQAVTDVHALQEMQKKFAAYNIGLAYDDFGAGQARLMELMEAPPDFIKLDMSLVRDIDKTSARQGLVEALVRIMRDLNIRVLAEGVETEAEALRCREIGCQYAQGYYFSRPLPIDKLGF